MRRAPPPPRTSLGRGAQTRRASVQCHAGWAPCRAGNLSQATAASLCLWGGVQPLNNHLGNKRELL